MYIYIYRALTTEGLVMEKSSSAHQTLSLLWRPVSCFEKQGLLPNLAELDGLPASRRPVYRAKHLCG